MKKSFGFLWGIVFVFIVAGNAHAMPWKQTTFYNPLGDTIAFGDVRWNQTGWGFMNRPGSVLNQKIEIYFHKNHCFPLHLIPILTFSFLFH